MKVNNQIIFLGTTAYEILASEQQLRQYDKPDHIISLKDIPVHQEVHEFTYDTINNRVVSEGTAILPAHERVQVPVEIAALDGQPSHEDITYYNQKSKQTGCGFYLADDYLWGYLSGRPIEFDFEGTRFTLDTPNFKLFETANPKNQIDLSNVEADPFGYSLNYHKTAKNLAKPADDKSEIVLITLDQIVRYDPVGMAKKHGISVGRLPEWDNDLKYAHVRKKLKSFYGELTKPKLRKTKGKHL